MSLSQICIPTDFIWVHAGHVVKFGLGLVSIIYCGILACQHYFLYPPTSRRPDKGQQGAAAGMEQAPLLRARSDASV